MPTHRIGAASNPTATQSDPVLDIFVDEDATLPAIRLQRSSETTINLLEVQGAASITGTLTASGGVTGEVNAAHLDTNATGVGFYGTAPIAKQTGVAVTAGGIHAALVALGLIAA